MMYHVENVGKYGGNRKIKENINNMGNYRKKTTETRLFFQIFFFSVALTEVKSYIHGL